MKKNKRILITLGIIFLIAIIIILAFFIQYKMKWSDFEDFSTDMFSIKYPEGWTSEDESSDVGDVKNFKDDEEKNGVRVLNFKKSDVPENQNSLEKMKNNIMEQMETSSYKEYQKGEAKVENIKISNAEAIKLDYEYDTLFGNSNIIYVFCENDERFYVLVCQGEEIEIFNKVIESFKMK